MYKFITLMLLSLLGLSTEKPNETYVLYAQDIKMMESIKRGKEVYNDMCMYCHLPNGEGKKNVYPPLAKADFLMKNREESIKIIKYGSTSEILVNGIKYKNKMANPGLENDEIADVMNYITNAWGNKNDKMITVDEVNDVSED